MNVDNVQVDDELPEEERHFIFHKFYDYPFLSSSVRSRVVFRIYGKVFNHHNNNDEHFFHPFQR